VTTWLVAGLAFLGWHFATTFFVPAGAPQSRGWLIWPFGRESLPDLLPLRRLAPRVVPAEPAPTVALVLAAIASACLLVALAALLRIVVPEGWWMPAVVIGCLASSGLFTIYLGRWALLPLLVDAVLLWGVLTRGWGPATLLAAG
jgi:hypothetical protein